jgi:hypothetical protein
MKHPHSPKFKLPSEALQDAQQQRQDHACKPQPESQAQPAAGPPPAVDIVSEVKRFIERYVILPESAYLPLALWIIGTYVSLRFDCYAYLAILSPTKACGKTRLLEVIQLLAYRPYRGAALSPAVLYRLLAGAPTLLIDEIESLNQQNSETAQMLLAILNAGHRKDEPVYRCDGPNHTPKPFPVFGPKAFAAIKQVPSTLKDRSLVIPMQRKTKDQHIDRFLFARAAKEAKHIRQTLTEFAASQQDTIDSGYERWMDTADQKLDFLADRDADLCIPLFVICELSTSDRLDELKQCARSLCAAKTEDDVEDSYPLLLLRDIQTVWPNGVDGNPLPEYEAEHLLSLLKQQEESPWLDNQLTKNKLGRMLKSFQVKSKVLRVGGRTQRGYEYTHLLNAFTRYLPQKKVTSET